MPARGSGTKTAVAVTFADAHLCVRPWKSRQAFGDSIFAFSQIIDYAIEHELPLLGAGDLLDARVNVSTIIVQLQQQLDRLVAPDLPFLFIQGQHEGDVVPWFSLGPTARHVHGQQFNLGGLRCYGLDFQPADRFQAAIAEVPRDCSLLVAHQVFADFMGDVALPQGEFADLPEHVQILITGDYHQSVLSSQYRNKAGGRLLVYSPGATYQKKIDEPDDPSFGVLHADGTIVRVPLRSRVCLRLPSVATEADLDRELTATASKLSDASRLAEERGLPEELQQPLVLITYAPRLAQQVERLGKIYHGLAHVFWKKMKSVQTETATVPDRAKDPGRALTLESCLPEEVNPKKEPEVFQLCQRLLQAPEVSIEMEKIRQELLR